MFDKKINNCEFWEVPSVWGLTLCKWDHICTADSVPWYRRDGRNELTTISIEEAQLPETPVSVSVVVTRGSQPQENIY